MMAHDPKLTEKPDTTQETVTPSAPRNVPIRTALKAGADDQPRQQGLGNYFNRYSNSSDS